MKTIDVSAATSFAISRDELAGWLALIYPAPLGALCSIDESPGFHLRPRTCDDRAWEIVSKLMDSKTPPAESAEWALDLLLDAAQAGLLDELPVLTLRLVAWRIRRLARLCYEDAQGGA